MIGVPFVRGSATSEAAAVAIEGIRRGQERIVFAYLQRRGPHGATDEEIARDTGLNPSSARPRRIRLVAGGFLEVSGLTRATSAGRSAVVFRVSAAYRPGRQLELL